MRILRQVVRLAGAFHGVKVEKDKTFEEYLNKYTVIYLDVTSFTARPELGDKIVRTIQNEIISEVKKCYPDVDYSETTASTITTVAVKNCDANSLELDFDGEIRKFTKQEQ